MWDADAPSPEVYSRCSAPRWAVPATTQREQRLQSSPTQRDECGAEGAGGQVRAWDSERGNMQLFKLSFTFSSFLSAPFSPEIVCVNGPGQTVLPKS